MNEVGRFASIIAAHCWLWGGEGWRKEGRKGEGMSVGEITKE